MLYGCDAETFHHRFLVSVAQPSMPSPLLRQGILSVTPSIPSVSDIKGLLLIPPAFALSFGSNANIGSKKLAILSA